MKKLLLPILLSALLLPAIANAATIPTSVMRDTTSGTIKPLITTDSLTIPQLGGAGTKCIQVDNNGLFAVSASACGSGSGGTGGGSWATTTSQVTGQWINYSLNNTDIPSIGGNATTTAKFYFDPNALFAKIGGQLYVDGSSTLQTTAITAIRNLGTNGFVKTSGGTGALSVDTTTYLSAMTFGWPFTKLGTNEQSTSTTLVFGSGFITNGSSTLPKIGNLTSNGFVKTSGGDGTLSVDTATYLTGMTFAWPFTKQAGGEHSTTTIIEFAGGFLSNASSTLASTTATTFLATNATTTNLAATASIILNGTSNGCAQFSNAGQLTSTGSACGSGGGLPWPFTKLGTGEQATSTTLAFLNGFLSTASSTMASTTVNGNFLTNFATSTTLAITGIPNCDTIDTDSNGVLKCGTDASAGGSTFAWPFTKQADNSQGTTTVMSFLGGFYSSASSTLTNFTFTNSTGTAATTTNLAVTASGLLSKIPFIGADGSFNPLTVSTGLSLSAGGVLTNSQPLTFAWPWTKQAGGEQATSTIIAFQGGLFSNASSTINSTLLVAGSSTLQNFTASNATTSSATTTNLYISGGFDGYEIPSRTIFASSTLDADGAWAATATTSYQSFFHKKATITEISCKVTAVGGTGIYQVGNGTASSTIFCSSTFTKNTGLSIAVNGNSPLYESMGTAGTAGGDNTLFSVYYVVKINQ